MGSFLEMNNTVGQNVTGKPTFKATPAVRIAFDELVSEEGFVKSSEIILKYFTSLMSPGQENEELCEDAKYVVKRLITSLTSQRMLIRQGCYTIFQVMLQLYPQILKFSFSFIEKYYEGNQYNKESLTDVEIGHALALGAIIRSGLVMEDDLILQEVIKKLLEMKDSKFAVGPVVGQFLVNLLSMYKDPQILQTIWRDGKESLIGDIKALTTPLLWLRILIAREEFIKDLSDVPDSFQQNTYDKSTYEYVFSLLKKLYSKHVNITPFVEDYFKSLILYQPSNSEGEDNNLSLFFSTAVTPALSSSNLKNNVLLFNISQVALSNLISKKSIEAVLSPELMEMLILSCGSNIEEVSASAMGLFSAILQLLVKNKENDSKIQIAVIKCLATTSCKLNLDSFTKTTILKQAYDNLSAESVIGFTNFLVKNSRDLATDSFKSKFKDVVSTCHWIIRLMNHSSFAGVDHCSWKAEQVSHLFRITYLSGFNKMQQHHRLKDCFLKGLAQFPNKFEFQASFIEEIADHIHQLMGNEEFKELNADEVNLFFSITDKLKKLPSEGNETLSSDDVGVFKILYGYLSLGVFIDPKDSERLFEEIKQCYVKASKAKKKKGKSSKRSTEEGEEPDWREVVMDLLLLLISKEESFWRKVATIIFTNICHKIKPSILSLLTDVINPEIDEPILEGKTDEEAMDCSSIIESDDEDDLDTSVEVETEEATGSEEEELEDESDEDEDDEEDEGKKENKLDLINLKKKMQEIVGLPMESVELDSVPQEELDNVDKKLGSLVTEYIALTNKRRKKKPKFNKDETALMHFRTRVCDLLETLIKEAPSLEHLLQVIKPILLAINQVVEDKLQIQFFGRLRSLIVEISKVKKFAKSPSISAEKLAIYLNDIFFMAHKFSHSMIADVNHCSTFLVRSDQYLNHENEKEKNVVMKTYTDYLERAFSETNTAIYDGPIHLETVSLETVLQVLSESIFKSNTQPFRKKKGSEMLRDILNNEKALNKMSSDHLNSVLQKINKEAVNAFDYVNEAKHVQSNYLVMLIEILKTIKKRLTTNPELEKLFDWDKVIESIQSFCQRVSLANFKSLKQAIQSFTDINNLQLNSNTGKKNNSSENGDSKQSQKDKNSKKKRKLEEENDESEMNEGKEEGGGIKGEEEEENVNKKAKMEDKKEMDCEGETVEKKKTKKKKKKKNNQEERIKKNEKRLQFSDEIGEINFSCLNSCQTEF